MFVGAQQFCKIIKGLCVSSSQGLLIFEQIEHDRNCFIIKSKWVLFPFLPHMCSNSLIEGTF